MGTNITDTSYYYKRKNGDFPAAWAAVSAWCRTASQKYPNNEFFVPTSYSMDGRVYASNVRSSNMTPFGAFWQSSGRDCNPLGQGTEGTTNMTAFEIPFVVCVTYDYFKNLVPPTNVTQWRELGVNPTTGGSPWGYTNRLISQAAMGDYVYPTGFYVLDNMYDGEYGADKARVVFNNVDIFTVADVSSFQWVLNGNAGGTYNENIRIFISMYRQIVPYYTTTARSMGIFPAQFNAVDYVMRQLGTPISKRIAVAGVDSSKGYAYAFTSLYPTLQDMLLDIHAWGVPYTTDYDAALHKNTVDFPDYHPDGIPDNPAGGGDGDGDNFSDPIDFPAAPYSPASLGGYLTLVQSPAELKGLTEVIWKPVIKDLTDVLKVYFNTDNLTNSVLSIMFYPLDLAAMSLGLTHSDNIRIAWSTDNISADIMSNNVSHEIDAGYYDVTEYYGSFLDYAPYTTVDIWLPYIGYKPLDIDAVMSKRLSVKYFVDFIDGLATAVIYADGQPINTYTGQLGIDLAVTGRDNATKIRQTIDAVMTTATGVNKAVGGIMQGAAQAYAGNAGGAFNAISGFKSTVVELGMTGVQTALQQPSTVVYGTAGGENWLSMPQKCHLKFTRTAAASPASYINEMGYPTTYTSLVSKFAGYLKCAAVFGDFTGIPSEDAEEIQALLQSGVHIAGGAFD